MRAVEHYFDAASDAPLEHVEIRFQYVPATPDEGPSYASGGTPGEPASVEWIEVSVKAGGVWHHDTPVWLAQAIFDQHQEDCLFKAQEFETARREEAADRRWIDRMENAA